MRIVYVLDTLARVGGVERIMADKMNWFADVAGHEVVLVTSAQGRHPHSFPLSVAVRHIDIDARFHVQYRYHQPVRLLVRWLMNLRFRRNLKRLLRRLDPDILIATTYYKADVICSMPCRAVKIVESHCARSFTGVADGQRRNPVVQWLHDLALRGYNRRIERRADVVVALTGGDACEWRLARRVCVIPNMYSAEAPAVAEPRGRRVIAVGRLIHQKGFDLLISSWRKVARKHGNWRLDIFGAGEEEGNLKAMIEQYGLRGNVTIHKPVPNITDEYARSALMVLSSRYEGFGLVLIESMLCGTPCVSFDCPYGPADIIRHGEDGLLVPNGDTDALAQAICRLIEHDDERTAYGRRAAENVRRYAPDVVMPQWTALFKQLLSRNTGNGNGINVNSIKEIPSYVTH